MDNLKQVTTKKQTTCPKQFLQSNTQTAQNLSNQEPLKCTDTSKPAPLAR